MIGQPYRIAVTLEVPESVENQVKSNSLLILLLLFHINHNFPTLT